MLLGFATLCFIMCLILGAMLWLTERVCKAQRELLEAQREYIKAHEDYEASLQRIIEKQTDCIAIRDKQLVICDKIIALRGYRY